MFIYSIGYSIIDVFLASITGLIKEFQIRLSTALCKKAPRPILRRPIPRGSLNELKMLCHNTTKRTRVAEINFQRSFSQYLGISKRIYAIVTNHISNTVLIQKHIAEQLLMDGKYGEFAKLNSYLLLAMTSNELHLN